MNKQENGIHKSKGKYFNRNRLSNNPDAEFSRERPQLMYVQRTKGNDI